MTYLAENKWRAMKDGINGSLIDFGKKTEGLVSSLIEEIIDLVDDVLDPLGTREEVENIRTILKNGASADRQLANYEETGSLESVVDQLGAETLEGV